MTTGTVMMALVLAVGAPPDDVDYIKSRNIQLPITFGDAKSQIKEIKLLVSTDEGKTWTHTASAAPEKQFFTYFAPIDGPYWFTICVIDQQGKQDPPDPYKAGRPRKIFVDTIKPVVRISTATRQGDDVQVAWEIQEDHVDLSTLKVEYKAVGAQDWAWFSAPATPGIIGQTHFRFADPGPLVVRVQVADLAHNVGQAQADVQTKIITTSATPPTLPATSVPVPAVGGLPDPRFPGASPGGSTVNSTLPQVTAPALAGPAPVLNNGPATTAVAPPGVDRFPPVQPVALRQPPERNWAQPAPGYPQGGAYAVDTGYRSPPPAFNHWPAGPVPTQITNNPQVALEYEVTKVGPSGVGSVELYVTTDEGRNWQRLADDPDLKSPVVANLPGEGVYGLRLVIASRVGLGRRPPQPGDLPELRVEVDTTPPQVKLFPPQPDPRRRDALVLTWSASDNHNLLTNPITIQWADRPDGTWQTIAADLSNSGRYNWILPPGVPYRVYLRLIARDSAGNIGYDETPEPVYVDLHEPEGHLLGISSSSRPR